VSTCTDSEFIISEPAPLFEGVDLDIQVASLYCWATRQASPLLTLYSLSGILRRLIYPLSTSGIAHSLDRYLTFIYNKALTVRTEHNRFLKLPENLKSIHSKYYLNPPPSATISHRSHIKNTLQLSSSMSFHQGINVPRPQPCDSYFVESQDSAAELRQYEGIIKRQRQDRIADELSMEIRSQYMNEIVEHMAFMEVRLTPPGIAATRASS